MKHRVFRPIAIFLLTLTVALGILPAVHAQQLTAGTDYRVIVPALPSDNPGKIEVIEFFSYACPHCHTLNPIITLWASRQPSDVVFRRLPISGSPFYTLMARLYYALESVGEVQRLDTAIFDALHNKNLRLVDEKSLTEWLASQNVDIRKFSEAFNAFGVDSKLRRAEQLRQTAKIGGVPAIVVDGRYQVISKPSMSYDGWLLTAGQLVEKSRAERKQKK